VTDERTKSQTALTTERYVHAVTVCLETWWDAA